MNADYAGDFEIVAHFLNPTDTYLLCSCLKMAGVPALVADFDRGEYALPDDDAAVK